VNTTAQGGTEGHTTMADGIVTERTYATPPPAEAARVDAAPADGAPADAARADAAPAVPVFDESPAGAAREVGNRRALVTLAADVVALDLSMLLALLALPLVSHGPLVGRALGEFSEVRPPFVAIALIVPWTIFVLYGYGLYRSSARNINGWVVSEGLRGLTALSVAAWSALVIMLVVDGSTDSLGFIAVYWACAALIVPTTRTIARAVFWRSSHLSERTLIVGAGAVGHLLAEKIAKHPEYNIRLVGFLDDGEPVGHIGQTVPVIGPLDQLDRALGDYEVTRVIIAFSRARHQQILEVVRTCADRGVRVNIVPRLFEILSSQTAMDDVEGIPLLDVAQVELSRFNVVVKRIFDLIVGGLLTLVLLPVMGALALAIKIDSRGPVFFRQERMGRGGKVFRIFKLRSMHVNAEQRRGELDAHNEYSGPMFKMKADPRVTRVGAFLRAWSLDEMPQLFNVLKGEMSLIGPRPLWVDEAARCRGWTKKRLDITPGITGLWQVTGRNDIPFDEMVKLDYMYVTGWTLSWDIKLLIETVPAVLSKRGAY